jgi:hypothetical protein
MSGVSGELEPSSSMFWKETAADTVLMNGRFATSRSADSGELCIVAAAAPPGIAMPSAAVASASSVDTVTSSAATAAAAVLRSSSEKTATSETATPAAPSDAAGAGAGVGVAGGEVTEKDGSPCSWNHHRTSELSTEPSPAASSGPTVSGLPTQRHRNCGSEHMRSSKVGNMPSHRNGMATPTSPSPSDSAAIAGPPPQSATLMWYVSPELRRRRYARAASIDEPDTSADAAMTGDDAPLSVLRPARSSLDVALGRPRGADAERSIRPLVQQKKPRNIHTHTATHTQWCTLWYTVVQQRTEGV